MLTINELGWHEISGRLREQWHKLIRDGDFHLSLAPEWIEAIASAKNKLGEIKVLVAERDGVVVGVMPYYVETTRMLGLPMQMVCLPGNLVSYHQEIVAKGCQLDMLRGLLQRANSTWHVYHVAGLCPDSQTAEAIRAFVAESRTTLLSYPGESSPYLQFSGSWNDFLASKSRNFRYNMKRKERRLEKAGELESRWYTAPEDVTPLYECMLRIEANSWKRNAGIAVTNSSHEPRYYEKLLPFLAERNALFANALFLDGKPIAYHLCCNWSSKIGNLKHSFDDDYESLSPGAVVIAHAIEKSFDVGTTEFDFLGDAQHHKLLWTDQLRPHNDYFVFSRRLRSRVISLVKRGRERIRPAQKAGVIRRSSQ